MAAKKAAATNDTYARLSAQFPIEDHSKVRKGGREQTYVDAEKVITRIDEVLGWDWSFRVIREGLTSTEAWVLGEITATIDGKTVTRQQYGCEGINRGERAATDLMKIAATDSLKKCATLFGVCRYLYNEDERKEVESEMREASRPTPIRPPNGARKCVAIVDEPNPGDTCENVVPAGADLIASMKEFDKPFCANHLTRARQWKADRQRLAEQATKAKEPVPTATVDGSPLKEIVDAAWGPNPETTPEPAPDASKEPTAAPTATKPPNPTTGAVTLPPTSTGQQCGAMLGPNRDRQCDAILYPGTGEPYNGRNVKAEQIIERSKTQFGRVLCGRHFATAVEHKRKKEQAAAS